MVVCVAGRQHRLIVCIFQMISHPFSLFVSMGFLYLLCVQGWTRPSHSFWTLILIEWSQFKRFDEPRINIMNHIWSPADWSWTVKRRPRWEEIVSLYGSHTRRDRHPVSLTYGSRRRRFNSPPILFCGKILSKLIGWLWISRQSHIEYFFRHFWHRWR